MIVGSGPAGVSAAESNRRAGGTSAATIVTDDRPRPYLRPPLSKNFLQGDASASDIALHPPEWFRDLDIELIRQDGVVSIDTHAQRATTRAGRTIPYTHLILATGAEPKPFTVPGRRRALTLRSFHDAQTLRDAAEASATAVVVGAGFIGCEAAASLALRRIATTLVSPDEMPQRNRLGNAAGERITGLLAAAGPRYVGA